MSLPKSMTYVDLPTPGAAENMVLASGTFASPENR